MPIYRVQAPDGNVYKIEGPANANHEDLFRTIAEQNPMAAKTTQELQAEKSAPTSISDLARTAGSSLVGAGKSLVDVFGAGSDISSYLGDVAQKLEQGKTPERLAEIARRQELSKRAEKEGTWAQIKSGLAGVAEAPIESLVSGVFSAAPTIATGAAALAALPASAPAALAVGVQRASQILIAAAQGTGEVKGDIHDAIKQAYKEKNPNMAPEEVERLATEAQAYTLKNAPTLIGGAAFGALDALTGFEKSTTKALRSAFDTEKKAFTKEGLQAAIAQLPEKAVQAPTYLGQAFKTGIGEAIPEGLQGGYGQLAQNVAMSQAGFETPTFQGVAGAAARDALVGALTGTAMSPLGRSVAHAEFEADKYLRGVKAEQELQTQREEFAKQQEQTKENLGVGKTLALGYEPKAEEEKYTNPAATITKDMLTKRGGPASQELKFVDEYRKQNGLPPLKAYSIEDIKDAMPGIDPEGEQGRIDSILAAVYDYKPVDDITGKPVNYTPDDVVSAAEDEKNIATGTKGFSDFLTRVTGSSDLNTMTQPQLFAAFQAVKQMPESEEKQILPEGTGASRFTDKQYKQAVSWFSQTFEQFDNKPLSRETIVQDIQEATGLEQKQDAEALLNTAVKNGDLAETEEKVFRTYDDNGKLVSTYRDKAKADAAAKKQGLNVKEERLKQLTPPPAAQPAKRLNLPAGYEMTKETVKEGEIPAGFEIFPEGRGKALVTVPTEAELQAKVESLTGARKNEAAKTLANMNRDIATLKKARDSLESMEARGEVGSQAYELAKTRLAKQERVLGKRIERHKERIEGYQAPLKTRPTEAKKQVTREKITVTKGGKSLGSFPDNVKAQEAILVQMTDEELAATASDGRLGAIADRAALEIERRKQPAGIIVKRTPKAKEELPPLSPELQAAADEIAKKLVPILQRMGLGDVGLKIVQSIKNGGEGSYTKNLIQLAIDADKPLEVMHHESLHALKDLGFFTDQQWATLEKQAEKVWINKYLKNVQSEITTPEGEKKTMSRYDAYVSLGYTPEEIREEAIADAFADFATTKPPGGMIASIMKRLNDLFKAIKNAFNRSGFESAEDIFGKAQRGELKGVKSGETKPTEPTQRPSTGGDETERLSTRRAGERRGRLPDGSPAPLEGAPAIEGATGPDPRLVEVAKAYAKKAGIPFRAQAHYSFVYPQKASRIAKAYDEMEHAPNDPRVKEAYQELIDQTRAQYDALTDAGYKFTFFDSNTDPYGGNPFNAMRDLRQNKEMAVYGTYDGYGTEGITGAAVEDNPMLEDTGLRWKDQKGVEHSVTANDLFRAVHDAFGHGLEGAGFRARGEENAWQAHSKMYTGLARGAMTSETRGQNSWLNFGPYGEKNRTAKLEDTVFAQQKTGLMPEWTWNEGMVSDEEGVTLGKLQPQAQVYDAVHYGKQPSLNALNGDRYGEGIRGGERRRLEMSDDPRIKKRAYFYIENDKGEMPTPESGLGANVYTQRFNNILGPGPAMSEISRAARGDSNTFESEVIDAGYDGYAIPSMGMMVILNHNPPVNYQGTRPELQEKLSLKIVRDNEPVNLGEKPTVNAIGKYFDKSVMDAFGRKLSYQNGEDFERAFKQASEEIKYQLEQENSGLDWYDNDIKSAFKETAKLIPELKKSENRILFSVIAGIMSPQTVARDNWFIAAKNFQNYLATGNISGLNPETGGLWQGGTQSANKKVQLEFLDAMIKDMGKKKALAWVMSDHPVSEINSFRQKYGKLKSGIEGKMTDIRPGLYAFGPKVGPFVSNLNGIHDVTVDKWMTRTFNRYFGTMIGPDGNIIDAPTEPQRRAIKRLVNEVAQNANIKPYQVQSLLWFYEQKLFTKLGVPSPSYAFSDGARRFTQDARDRGGEEGVAGAAEPTAKLSLKNTIFAKRLANKNISNIDEFWNTWGNIMLGTGAVRAKYGDERNNTNQIKEFIKVTKDDVKRHGIRKHLLKYGFANQDEDSITQSKIAKLLFESAGIKPTIRNIVIAYNSLDGQPISANDAKIIDLTPDDFPPDAFEQDWFNRRPLSGKDWLTGEELVEPNAVNDIKFSLRSTRQPPESKEFKNWFTGSYFTSNGEPLIMYHGTARDITIFKGKQAKAIFVTTKPEVAEDYANMGVDYMRTEAYKALTRDEKVELITTVAEQAERDGTIDRNELKEITNNLKKRVPPIDPEKNRILDLPYQIEGEIIESLNNLLPTKGNIMPVYVNAKNIFDYANKDDVNRVYNWMMNNSSALGRMENPERWLSSVKSLISRGNWPRIESPEVQEAIRALGFDGFSVLEAGTKNYAVYNPTAIKSVTGNIGTFGLGEVSTEQAARFGMTADQARQAQAEGDIRFSLKKVPIGIPENIWNLHIAHQEAEAKALGTMISQQKTAVTKAFKRLSKAAQTFTGNQQDALNLMSEMNAISDIRQAMAEDDTRMLDIYKVVSPALWRQETGEKLSLRATTSAATNAAVERTTTAREEKGFIERMMDAISPKSWSDFRAKSMNRYNAMGPADQLRAKKMGGAALLADQSAEAAALMSDLAAGVTASALGVHDRHGGAPVFRNGITTIDSSIKGPVAIFAPLAKYGDPYVYQLWQFYAGAKRGRRLFKEGREENYKPSDFPLADKLAKDYPEFERIFEEWNKFNDALVQYQIDTGVLSKERADEYRKYSDYIPFYRQLEGEPTVGPRVFQSISGVKPTAKLKGAELPIADLMETIVRNVQSGIQAGMKNHAARQAIKVFSDIQQAAPAPQNSTSPYVVHVLENGVKTAYDVADPALFNSMQSLNLPDLPFLGFFAGPANLLRNLVTKDPGFMLANMVRDSMSAWVTSGVKMTPIASAVKNFTGALRGTSPEFQALLNAGVLGGYEFSQNVEASGKQLHKELAKYGPSTTLGKIKKPFTSVWEALEKGTTASDAATRMEVYKNVLAETGNEAEAIFRALEVMNFNRKGSSAVIRILTAAVPFLNARIQGLDVLYRASFGKMATQDAKAIQKSFFIRGATIMALSMMYWGLTHDDDDYKKQEQETRDNYWLVPRLGIKIPIPFEVGVIFKVIPERIAEYSFGTDTGKDFANAMTRALVSTFAFNPIPQTILPLVEAKADYSFFTGRSILGQGMKNIAPEYQVGPNTSNLAKWFASITGGMTMLPDYLRSPAMIDHIIGGYTGTFGTYAADAIDAIVSANSDVPKASKRFEQMPVLRRFLLDPEARGNVTAYYDLKNTVDEAVRTSNFLERTMSFEDLAKYNTDVVKTLATADLVKSMDKDMKELNNFAVQVRSSPMDSDEKRDLLRAINQAQNNMTANIKLIKKSMD